MQIRRFNNDGLELYSRFVDDVRQDPTKTFLVRFLEDEDYTVQLEGATHIEECEFTSRFEFAEYIDAKLKPLRNIDVQIDRGLWAWLTAFYFDMACPMMSDGKRRPGEHARYFPNFAAWNRRYRHLLASPWSIYAAHIDDPERVKWLLSGPVDKPGELNEQFASRQEIIRSPGVLVASGRMYYDASTKKIRRGVRGRLGGSLPRFGKLLNQLDRTWDLYSITPEGLVDLLPSEFDRWKDP